MICNPLEIARIILNLRRWIYNVQLYHLSVFPYERSWLWPVASALQIVQRSDPPLQTASPPSRFHPHENTACCKDRGRSLTRREMWNKFTWPRRRWKDSSPRGKFLRKNPKPFRFKRKKKKTTTTACGSHLSKQFFYNKKTIKHQQKKPFIFTHHSSLLQKVEHLVVTGSLFWKLHTPPAPPRKSDGWTAQ